MLDSLEGKRGEVRAKPPIPALHGLFGRPTVVNNVLTLAAVPMVVGTWPLLLMGIYAVSKRKDKIAKQEKEQALAEVVAQAKAEADAKVSEVWKKAAQEKEKAIEAAVKQALEAAADPETEETS
jgi:biopolymer transport protein ExbB/TolQ